MPITFKSKRSPDIVMLETMGLELIRMMGHSGTVPGSLAAEDVAVALQHLEEAMKAGGGRALNAERPDPDDEDDGRAQITLAQRAGPLRDMLVDAAEAGDYVIWDR